MSGNNATQNHNSIGGNDATQNHNSISGNNATQVWVFNSNNYLPIVTEPVVINNTDTFWIPVHKLLQQQQLGFTPLVSAFSPLGTSIHQSGKP